VTESSGKIDHYALVGSGRSRDNPSGLVRRRFTPDGRVDEALQRDMSWHSTSAITQWEYGNLPGELVEVSEGEAERLIERFRVKWAEEG
jgi:hypothetical protein